MFHRKRNPCHVASHDPHVPLHTRASLSWYPRPLVVHASVVEVWSSLVPGHFCQTRDLTVLSLTRFLGPGPGPPWTVYISLVQVQTRSRWSLHILFIYLFKIKDGRLVWDGVAPMCSAYCGLPNEQQEHACSQDVEPLLCGPCVHNQHRWKQQHHPLRAVQPVLSQPPTSTHMPCTYLADDLTTPNPHACQRHGMAPDADRHATVTSPHSG